MQIRAGNSGCSGTLFRMDSSDQYWLLTCGHCVHRNGETVYIRGDTFQLTGVVERFNRQIDICLVRVNERGRQWPVAKIAETPPARGDRVWHHGFGVDRPGNIERGQITTVGDSRWACWYTTALSSGDSGSGQFLESNGELVALGAWGDRPRFGGASLLQIRAFIWPAGGAPAPNTPPPGSAPFPSPSPWPPSVPGCPDGTCPRPGFYLPSSSFDAWLHGLGTLGGERGEE